MTRDEEADLEAEKRRRRGEAEGEFQKLTRKFSRQLERKRETPAADTTTAGEAAEIPADAYEHAISYLSHAIDSMNPYCEPDACVIELDYVDDAYMPPQDYPSLQP